MTLERIIWHWTAGGPDVTADEKTRYHYLIDQEGHIHQGTLKPEDNLSVADGVYTPHTLHANTGAIGLSLCGMAKAVQQPFKPGPYPINTKQVTALLELSAELCKRYAIPVSRTTTLSHAEVQPTLGIKQRGKWDIAWLPGMLTAEDPVSVGDKLRSQLAALLKQETTAPESRLVLQLGDRGAEVKLLQRKLGMEKEADGIFGAKTLLAVKLFQAEKKLEVDGIVGPKTWKELQ